MNLAERLGEKPHDIDTKSEEEYCDQFFMCIKDYILSSRFTTDQIIKKLDISEKDFFSIYLSYDSDLLALKEINALERVLNVKILIINKKNK